MKCYITSKTILIIILSTHFCGIYADQTIRPGQSLNFDFDIDYGAIVEPILEATNKTLNVQSIFTQDLENQEKKIDDLVNNIEKLPDVLKQIVDPIEQLTNQGIL